MNIDQESLEFAQAFGLDAYQHGALTQLLRIVYKQGIQDGIEYYIVSQEQNTSSATGNDTPAGSVAEVFRLGETPKDTIQPEPPY